MTAFTDAVVKICREEFTTCDFVVGFDAQKKNAIPIGGNVGNSVAEKTWPPDGQGHIGNQDPKSSIAKVICIIECRP